MALIYHITEKEHWERSRLVGSVDADSLYSEGFIHCSTDTQVQGVANRLFRGRRDLVLLKIDERNVKSRVEYENLGGGAELFPHIYGAIELAAITAELEFQPGPDGTFTFNSKTA